MTATAKSMHTASPARLPTVGGIVDILGPVAVPVYTAAAGMDVAVSEPVIYDTLGSNTFQTGDVVLAVGVAPGSAALDELVTTCARNGAAAIVVRIDGETGAAVRARPEASPVALLGIPHEMPWGQFYWLVRSTIDSVRDIPAEYGAIETSDIGLGDLYGLVNALAARAGGAALLDDAEFNVLAYSNLDQPIDDLRRQAVLRRRGPGDSWRRRFNEDGLHRRLRDARGVELVDGYRNARPRLVMPVRAGEELLGFLWVVEGNEPLGPVAEKALEEAGPIAALHLVRHRVDDNLERQLQSRALRASLEGVSSPEALAAQLGTVTETEFRVVAFSVRSEDELTSVIRHAWIADLVALHFEALQSSTACVTMGARVYALVSQAAAANEGRIVEICSAIGERIRAARHIDLWCGVGSCVANLGELKRSRDEADSVLDLLSNRSAEQFVASIDEVRAEVFLSGLRRLPNWDEELRLSKLQYLVEHDREHGTFYVDSLRAFLDAHGDFVEAASSLNVHPNTLRYRIRRAEEIAKIDLANADERLVLGLHLRMLPMTGEPGEPASIDDH